ncbi:TcaA NTF2-like domain-containing protein [Alkalihalobacillus sp. NPDC078783]
MSRTKWYVIGGSGVILGGILFFTGQAAADKENVLDSFLEAVEERDTVAVKKQLVSNHPDQDVDDEHVEAFFEVLDNSSEAHGELIQKWIAESDVMDSARAVSYYEGRYESFPVSFQQNGKKWLFFDNYEFVLEAQPLTVSSNVSDVTLQLNEEPVEPEESDSSMYLGDYLPANYQVKGAVENEFGANEQEETINLYNSSSTNLQFDLNTVSLDVEDLLEGTTLHVDGSEEALPVTSTPFEFGPILTDGSLNYYIEADTEEFGTLQSEVASIDGIELTSSFTPNEELKEQIESVMHDYLLSRRVAKQEKDIGKLTYASDSIKSSIGSNFEDTSIWGNDKFYAGYLLEAGFNWDRTTLEKTHHGWNVRVPAYEKWEETEYEEGDDPILEEVDHSSIYELKYEEGEWIVESRENQYEAVKPTESTGFDRDEQDEESSTEASIEEGVKIRLTDGDADRLVSSFVRNYVNGINNGSASVVENEVTSDYQEEVDAYMKDVFDRGIRQRFAGAEATNVTLNDDDSYTVDTKEEYEIRPKDGDYTKRTFEASYKVVYDEEDESWKISELIETNEVD